MAGPKLTGIFCPHMVPLDDRGRIHEKELRRLVEWLIQRGIHGLYPNGSTGEFTRFTFEERKEIVRIATEQANGRVKVMAGAAECNVASTVAACEYYHQIGCDAVAIVPPSYYPMRQPNVREYFLTVASESPIDITVYHIPQFSNGIELDTLKAIAEHPKIIGIKDSSRDMPGFMVKMHEIRPLRPDFCFLIGCEEILVPTLIMGGDGGTIATSGVVPELVVKIYDLVKAGQLDQAIPLQYSLLKLIDAIVFGTEFPEGVRVALELRGFSMGDNRMPQAPEMRANAGRLRSEMMRILAGLSCDLEADGELPAACTGPTGRPAAARSVTEIDEATLRGIVAKVVEQIARGSQ